MGKDFPLWKRGTKGDSSLTTGLKLRGHSDVTVKDCVFKDNTNSGILIRGGISGTIKDDSLYDNGIGINIQGLHTTKSPYIPLYKRGRLEKDFPLWKRGTKGDFPQRKERDNQ